MEYFEYKTRSSTDGKINKGILTADTPEGVEEILKRRGDYIIEISRMRDFLNIRKIIYGLSSKTNKKTKLEFITMIKFMLESGISLHEALTNIRDTGTNKSLKGLTSKLTDEVRKGASLSSAMKSSKQFDQSTVEQVKAGEEAGNINDTLDRLINQYEREIDFSSRIKSAMIYPVIIFIVMIAVLWVMMTVVVPTLADTLISMGGELPLITKILIIVSDFISKATPYIILFIILTVILYKTAVKEDRIRLAVDKTKLKIPVVGKMLEKIELARFCRNLSIFQKSGISLVHSLKIVAATIKNKKIADSITQSGKLVEISGINLATALYKSGCFPDMMLHLIEIGVDSGSITDVLDRIAEQYEKDIDVLLKRIMSVIEPVMIVFVGLIVGTVVLGFFLPMYSIVDNIGV